jgi:hypothetical protein
MERTIRVERPAGEVFDFLADARNELSWNDTVLTMEKVTAGPIGAGTRFRGDHKRIGVLDSTITAFERPARLSFHGEGKAMRFDAEFAFEQGSGVTTIRETIAMEFYGLLRLLAPLLGGSLRRQFAAEAEALKRALERSPDHGGTVTPVAARVTR